jgi:hypothetical protein
MTEQKYKNPIGNYTAQVRNSMLKLGFNYVARSNREGIKVLSMYEFMQATMRPTRNRIFGACCQQISDK